MHDLNTDNEGLLDDCFRLMQFRYQFVYMHLNYRVFLQLLSLLYMRLPCLAQCRNEVDDYCLCYEIDQSSIIFRELMLKMVIQLHLTNIHLLILDQNICDLLSWLQL